MQDISALPERHAPLSPDLIICRQRIIEEPAFFYLRHITDEDLVPSLHNLVENDPIRFPILLSVRRIHKCPLGCSTYKHQRAGMSMQSHAAINCFEGAIRLHSRRMSKVSSC